MAANTKQRKGFKERKARNRRLLDEARNRDVKKRENIIKMIQEQMNASEDKTSYIQDAETVELNNIISTQENA